MRHRNRHWKGRPAWTLRLDALARSLGAAPTRRAAVRGLLGGLLGSVGLLDAGAQQAAGCFAEGARCRKPSQCCSKQCRDGACTGGCPAGKTACGRDCVNLDTDPKHCGGCDRRCDAGQFCKNGRCQCGGKSCTGCCDGTTCVPVGKQGNGRCGNSGRACATCPSPCQACVRGRCAAANQFEPCRTVSTPAGDAAVRCCNGVCDPDDCLPFGTPCDNVENCEEQCCTEQTTPVCPTQPQNCFCFNRIGGTGPCLSDADCFGFPNRAECRCGTCCLTPGSSFGLCPGNPAACCSGECDGSNCA